MRARRQNDEDIRCKGPPGGLAAFPRFFVLEIEVILTSFQDLIKMLPDGGGEI